MKLQRGPPGHATPAARGSRGKPALGALVGVSSTLAIPLLARAFADAWFPAADLGDLSAARVVAGLDAEDVRSQGIDPAMAYSMLVRTRLFRAQAQAFFARWPSSAGVNLACGLADYFQWLDNGRNRWVDVDLPCVVSLRQALMPPTSRRQRLVCADLTGSPWWSGLGIGGGVPVLVMCEGLLMYLEPPQVESILCEIAARAPAGSQILVDALAGLALGEPWWCPAVYRRGVQFRWGLPRAEALALLHPRLRLLDVFDVGQACGLPYSIVAQAFRFQAGVPFYGVYRLAVEDVPVRGATARAASRGMDPAPAR